MTIGTRAAAEKQGQQLAQIKIGSLCGSGHRGFCKSKELGERRVRDLDEDVCRLRS